MANMGIIDLDHVDFCFIRAGVFSKSLIISYTCLNRLFSSGLRSAYLEKSPFTRFLESASKILILSTIFYSAVVLKTMNPPIDH